MKFLVSCDNSQMYAPYWPHLKRHLENRFGWTAQCLFVGDDHDPMLKRLRNEAGSDSITVLPKPEGQLPVLAAAAWGRYYLAKLCPPDEVVCTLDIDQFPISKRIFLLAGDPGQDYQVLVNRGESFRDPNADMLKPTWCRGRRSPPRSIIGAYYHIAKASTFCDVHQFHDDWAQETQRMYDASSDLFTMNKNHSNQTASCVGLDESWGTANIRRWMFAGGNVQSPLGFGWFVKKRRRLERHFRRVNPDSFDLAAWVDKFERLP